MPTLNYQPTLTQDPRIYPAATHLFVWSILNYVLAAFVGVVLVLLLLIYGLFAYFVSGQIEHYLETLILVTLVGGFFFILLLVYAHECQTLRDQLLSLSPNAAATACRWSAWAILIAALPALITLTSIFFQSLHTDSLDLPKTALLLIILALPIAPVLWTRRVLRRAHDATTTASSQSPPSL